MILKFRVSASRFDPFERESIKRSIINQGSRQHILVRAVTDLDHSLKLTLEGDDLAVIAYEAAVCSWFNQNSW